MLVRDHHAFSLLMMWLFPFFTNLCVICLQISELYSRKRKWIERSWLCSVQLVLRLWSLLWAFISGFNILCSLSMELSVLIFCVHFYITRQTLKWDISLPNVLRVETQILPSSSTKDVTYFVLTFYFLLSVCVIIAVYVLLFTWIILCGNVTIQTF